MAAGDDFIYDADGTEVLRGGAGADHLLRRCSARSTPRMVKRDNFVLEIGLGMDTIHGFTQTGQWRPLLAAGEPVRRNRPQRQRHASQGRRDFSTPRLPWPPPPTQRLIFDYAADDKILYYDADGNGTNAAPIAIAKISGIGAISAQDFRRGSRPLRPRRRPRHRAQAGGSGSRAEVSFGEERTISVSVRSMPSTALTTPARKASSMRVFRTRTFRR